MKALIAQFLSEGRELLEGIGESMLLFERSPENQDNLNQLFRQVHTLKGNCGLFEELRPVSAVLHAAEDTLDAVREGQGALTPALSDLLLDAMDFVSLCLDDWEGKRYTEEDVQAKAQSIASSIRSQSFPHVDSLQNPSPESLVTELLAPVASAIAGEPEALPGWVLSLLGELPSEDSILQMVLYTPQPECFFCGEDPFQIATAVPGLKLVLIERAGSWLEPESFDVYKAQIRILIASEATSEEVLKVFECIPEQIQCVEVSGALGTQVDHPESTEALSHFPSEMREQARRIWSAQLMVLDMAQGNPGWEGRCRSVCSVISALSIRLGRPQWADAIAHITEVAIAQGEIKPLLEWLAKQPSELSEPAEQPEPLAPCLAALPEPLPGLKPEPASDKPSKAQDSSGEHFDSKTASVLKVSREKVDRLMELIGEMVVAKNSLPYLADRAESEFSCRELSRELKSQYSVINRIAEEMQHAIMQVRMLPVGSVFQRFPRLIRDLSKRLGKQVRLEVSGEDTEADKNMIEALSEPMIHLIRNSLDHGIEPPEDRLAAGKSVEGLISIRAWQEGDRVLIQIQDDGAGIDAGRVKQKALDKGLVPEDRLNAMTEQEIQQLIFLPGFSTANAISDVSGRGVGMDVVRSAISKSNGQVELSSVYGQGTTVLLSLPLSMAVSNVMMIECAQQTFGVPMDVVVETVRVHSDAIHQIQSQKATVLRGKIIPLVSLATVLGLDLEPQTNGDGEFAVLVVRLGSEVIGLLVDEFNSTVDILLRPLEGVLADMHQYCGSALLGNGTVLLVLNLMEVMACQSH